MGGPGVQRSTRFVQHIQDYGLEPVVFTIRTEDIEKSGDQQDKSLLNLIPNNIEVIRVSDSRNHKITAILNRLRIYRLFWFFLYPLFWERMAMWPYKSYKQAAETIKKNKIKIVYTSSGPFSSLILGYLLKKRLGIKWIADLRDPFTDAYAWSFPSRLHWLISRKFEKWILSKCDHLIVNTPEVKNIYLKRNILNFNSITVITNGY